MVMMDPDNWTAADWAAYDRYWSSTPTHICHRCADCRHFEEADPDGLFTGGVCLKDTNWTKQSLAWVDAEDDYSCEIED